MENMASSAGRGSEVFKSAATTVAQPTPKLSAAAEPQETQRQTPQYEKVQEITPSKDDSMVASKLGASGAVDDSLKTRLEQCKRLAKTEQEHIDTLQAQIKKIAAVVGESSKAGSAASGSQSGGWAESEADSKASKGAQFKFVHLIIVSILFLLLGSYLAKSSSGPVPQIVDEPVNDDL